MHKKGIIVGINLNPDDREFPIIQVESFNDVGERNNGKIYNCEVGFPANGFLPYYVIGNRVAFDIEEGHTGKGLILMKLVSKAEFADAANYRELARKTDLTSAEATGPHTIVEGTEFLKVIHT